MKEVSDFTEQFDRCLINEPPFCTAVCPFGLDARTFTEKIKQNRISAAYRQYRDAVVFPEIVSRLCDRPCENACPLGEIDNAIDLIGLERFVTETAGGETPESYNLPPRGKSVAIIGAGLSGLACALKLMQKKYDVTIFERRDTILAEVKHYFQNERYKLYTKNPVVTTGDLAALDFDAIYIATGAGGADLGLPTGGENPVALPGMILPTKHRLQTDCAGNAGEASGSPVAAPGARGGLHDLAAEAGVCLIAGGALIGNYDVYAIADGILAASAIDDFFKTGILHTARPPRKTNMILAPIHIKRYKDGRNHSGSQAQCDDLAGNEGAPLEEAERCLGCRCDACTVYSDLLSYTGKSPTRIRDEVFATTLPGKAEVKATPAKRLINTDNLSGVFQDVCPVGIDMDGLLLAGRQSMHRQNKMPWAFHEFWLRDMAHANGDAAAVALDTRTEAATGFRPLALFPGCQLGAASPSLVRAIWEELISMSNANRISLSGMILRCCGAPAEWAGDEPLTAYTLNALRRDWESLGRPALACACPSCMRMIAQNLPEIETISLYEILPPKPAATDTKKRAAAVFDPCVSARLPDKERTAAMRKSVREHAEAMGFDLEELPIQQNIPRCCGFGGQPEDASPDFVRVARENRAAESDLPYLCYCMNCREAFMKVEKDSAHILELRYPGMVGVPPELGLSRRRENREKLSASLRGNRERPGAGDDIRLRFADGLLLRMDGDKILTEDVRAVIAHMRRTKASILDPKTGIRSGSLMIGKTTYWVCFTEDAKGVIVTSVYSHRLAIEHEKVWAGVPV